MRPPNELGRPVVSHSPINPCLALTGCAVPGVLIGSGLWLGSTSSLAIGVFAWVLTTGLLGGLFAESLFVRQHIFEHGLLLSSIVPATPSYAIPYATIDADSIAAEGFRRPRGAADITDGFSRRYRQAPAVPVVVFVGIAPAIARDLARGRADWQAVIDSTSALPVRVRPRSREYEHWYVSFRDNGAAAATLRERVSNAISGPTG